MAATVKRDLRSKLWGRIAAGDAEGAERASDDDADKPTAPARVSGAREGEGSVAVLATDGLDDVDDYGWACDETIRWRSRLPSDPPFSGATIRYRIDYELSGILLKDGDQYRLDHDFVFPDRTGVISQFELRLTFDPAWQPQSAVRPVYTAGPLAPGAGYPWRDEPLRPERLAALWEGRTCEPAVVAAVTGTAAVAIRLMGRAAGEAEAQALAEVMWRSRDATLPVVSA